MARICPECRQPVFPVNECICDEDEPEDGSEDNAA